MKHYILIILLVIALTEAGQVRLMAQLPKGLKEVTNTELAIFPNPSLTGEFQVKGDFISEIEVLNLIGKSLYHAKIESPSQDEIKVRIENPEKGYYLVKVTLRDNKTVVKKILVK